MDISTNSNLYRFSSNSVNQTAGHDIGEHDEIIKRVRDTFNPSRDSFEKMPEQTMIYCESYTNYQVTTPMPKSIFGDSFGYDMQKSIESHMKDYYAGRMSDDDLNQYFNDCCAEMRKYRAGHHQSSGNVDSDNEQIVSQMYEIFAKENARAARRANYDEGAAINADYGNRNYDWVYYNADYYYQCAETKEKLGAMANHMAEKWGIDSIDTDLIEKNSDLTLDGGFDFNSGWNFTYRNQVGRASMAVETTAPPKDFKFFYKEDVNSTAKMDMWVNGDRYSRTVPFHITPDSMDGQRYQADEIMEDFDKELNHVKGYSDFMRQLSIFTGWYAWSTGINNHFGDYMANDFARWQYS